MSQGEQPPEEESAYEIVVTSAAARDLKALPRNILQRVDRRLLSLAADPRQRGASKLEGEEDLYRVRVGDYRILYQVDDENKMVIIARVRHRREAYR